MVAHDIVLPLVDKNLPDCPDTDGITCAEEPEIVPLITILPTVRVPFTVIDPELRLRPPEPDRSLIEDTFRVLIDYLSPSLLFISNEFVDYDDAHTTITTTLTVLTR